MHVNAVDTLCYMRFFIQLHFGVDSERNNDSTRMRITAEILGNTHSKGSAGRRTRAAPVLSCGLKRDLNSYLSATCNHRRISSCRTPRDTSVFAILL
jgi:hypothetical protein